MKPRQSFRTRLALQTMLVAGVLLAAFGTASWLFARRHLAGEVDVKIADSTRRIWPRFTPRSTPEEFAEVAQSANLALVVMANAEEPALIFSSNAALAKEARPFLDQLPAREELDRRGFPPPDREPPGPNGPEDRDFPPGLDGPRPPGRPFRRPVMQEIREPVFFTVATRDGALRFGAFSNPRYTIFSGVSLNAFYAEARRAACWYAAAATLGLALAGIGAWWTSARAMRPLDRIVATARNLKVSDFDLRIPSGPRDDREFSELIAVLNGMMDRLQTSFAQAARFTADASHELKTPLAVMQVTLHDALRRNNSGTISHDELESLARECARLKAITHSLLLLSQADAGKLPLTREHYDLSADLARLVEDADAICEQAGLTCEHYIQPGLWVEADRALMRQVFQNLLSNAVKYNRPGGFVKIALVANEGRAEFKIANTGPGIPAEAQPRLFERFFRADASRSTEGAGLGLNIAFELARANGAELQLVEAAHDLTCLEVRVRLCEMAAPRADSHALLANQTAS